jgi:peptidoglycan/LPS O-acetylase OafA/YrhL
MVRASRLQTLALTDSSPFTDAGREAYRMDGSESTNRMWKEIQNRFGRTDSVSATTHGSIAYRAEIDGLRAVAVSSVILFHAHFHLFGLELFKGGYVGVDIFFVISGYLITRIIFYELERDAFSLAYFYERRARRILPALLLLIAVTVVVGLLVMPPKPFSDLARSIFAVIFFVANIYFYIREDYFAEPSDLTPLLHTWSLSVEEQFYLLFPLLLVLVWKFARWALIPLLITGTVTSLLLAIYTDRHDPSAAFYLFHNRAWEILAGCLLARLEHKHNPSWAVGIAAVLPAVGFGLIGISICLLGFQETSIGWNTGLAVLGTALIIRFGNGGDPLSRLLARGPIVGLGLISYSLYLWHQPVFAFARFFMLNAPDNTTFLVLILICLCLAYLSWRFVELQFRRRNAVSVQKLALAITGSIAVILISAGLSEFTAGFPQRFTSDQLRLLDQKPERGTASVNGRDCRRQSIEDACIIGRPQVDPTFAVIGDSHAETLTGPLGDLFNEMSLAAYVYTYPACPFIVGVEPVGKKVACAEFEEQVIEALRTHRITSVIVNDRSTAYISGTGFDNGEGGVETGAIVAVRPVGFSGSEADRMLGSAASLRWTLLRLLGMGISVYYVLPVPEVGWHVPRTLVKLIAQNKLPLTTSFPTYLRRNRIVLDIARDLEGRQGFVPIYPHQILCSSDTARCYTHGANTVFYTDTDHLSRDGAEKLAATIASEIKRRRAEP